jgi:probable HAF family extracellular repeat protein
VGGATAMGINSSNQVVGYYFPNGATDTVGFSWTQSGGRQDLGPAGTIALAVNDAGTIVGSSPNAKGFRHAFIWTPTTGMQDLGTLGGAQSTALSVNNKGWVVGTSMTSTGNGLLHAFLWTPAGGMKDLVAVAGLGKALQPVSVEVNDSGVIAVSTNNTVTALFPIMQLTVTSSVNPSKVGKPVTFTATMSSFAGLPPNGDTVTFQSGSQILGTATFTDGIAQLTTTALTVGTRTIVAKFPGDPNYLPVKSPALTQIVTN